MTFVSPEEGETRGLFVADAETYGVNKLWVALRTIPIDVDGSDYDNNDDNDV